MKQAACLKFIYKIHSSRLRKAHWDLDLPLSEARKNEEVIALADSQVLRWIDDINGIVDSDIKAREIKREISRLKKEDNSRVNRNAIRSLYSDLDAIQFNPDYMSLIIDRNSDYKRACRGFKINGISYKRLLGTVGGVKTSTIVFVSERIRDEIIRRIDNGRNVNKEIVPAKLEAYKALTCSASIPVSMPNGILVVKDFNTKYISDAIYVTDECDGEPIMEYKKDAEIEMDASDGYGLMSPELAARWSAEMGLDYVTCGVNTRFSFEKGMVFTFDFNDFAKTVANKYIVKDVWGNDVDIRNVELILTESMLKLWDSYKSCDEYIQNCISNKYTFSIAKCCPDKLENMRNLNYQFIQSYDLSDEDIDELVKPTIDEIKDVLGMDWRKSVLFLKGSQINDNNISRVVPGIAKAIMVDHNMINDPYIKTSIHNAIKNRINEAKVGVINVHGNYSIVSGDPFSLCQSIFGMTVTGLLKSGEIYNKYWTDYDSDKLACFRAPMTCHNNIRIVRLCRSDDAKYWYRYMNACTILNSWDTMTAALNGCDFDGDLLMITDNRVLVEKCRELPALMCVQRKAKKIIPTEEDVIQANIDSFGNDVGRTTNWITSMFEVQSKFDPESDEYKELDYRIKCGQLYQQNVIDRAKGIISKPMPSDWYDRRALASIKDQQKYKLYRNIVASKKPYFMIYIYPALRKQYNDYVNNANKKSMREYGMSIDEMYDMPYGDLSQAQKDFLRYYEEFVPVGTGNCVMNRICWRIEDEFDGNVWKSDSKSFDYSIMKSGHDYTISQSREVNKKLFEFNSRINGYIAMSKYNYIQDDEFSSSILCMKEEFRRDCDYICQNNSVMCDILLDLCYKKSSTKKFCWDMCAESIVDNLLNRNCGMIEYPVLDDSGDIYYRGERFSIHKLQINNCEDTYEFDDE